MPRSPNIREIVDALEFARREVFRTCSPDFLRARVGEDRVQELCQRLIRGPATFREPENDKRKPA
jgi:DNA-directed RNA polymerase specialized sigma24 family protein